MNFCVTTDWAKGLHIASHAKNSLKPAFLHYYFEPRTHVFTDGRSTKVKKFKTTYASIFLLYFYLFNFLGPLRKGCDKQILEWTVRKRRM